MVEQLTLQTIGILLTGVSLTAAASYYIMTLRNTIKARKTQLAMQLLSQLNLKEFWEPYWDVMAKQDFSSSKNGWENLIHIPILNLHPTCITL